MKDYRVTLRDTRDGFQDTIDFPSTEDIVYFLWEDGNYSCDCNRSLYLYPDNPEKHLGCSDGVIELVDITD